MARKFFCVCAGMLMLALAYHFGYSTASAQAQGNPVVGIASRGGEFVAGPPMGTPTPWIRPLAMCGRSSRTLSLAVQPLRLGHGTS